MDFVQEIIPYLDMIVAKRKCAINVSKIDNEFVVKIIGRFTTKIFKSANSFILISDLKQYIQG